MSHATSSALQLVTGQNPLFSVQGHPVLYIPELVVLVAFIVSIGKRQSFMRSPRDLSQDAQIGLAALIIGSLAGILFSGDILNAFVLWFQWFFFPILGFVLIVHSPKLLKAAIALFMGGAVLEVFYALFLRGTHRASGELAGSFSSPVYFAMWIIPAFVYVLVLAKKQPWEWAVALVLGIGVGGSWVNMSLIALLVVALVAFWRSAYFPKYKAVFFGVLAAVLLVAAVFVSVDVSQQNSSFLNSHIDVWQTAVTLVSAQPVSGLGLGSFAQQYGDHVVASTLRQPVEWFVPLPYDSFLAFWFYTGIFGLVGYVYLIRASLQSKNLVYCLPFIALCGYGLLDTAYFVTPAVYVFWITLAIAIGYGRQKTVSVS